MWSADELIVAPATAPGAGARAIVRLAGEALAGLLPKLVDAEAWPQPGVRPTVVRGTLAADGLGGEWGPLPVEVLAAMARASSGRWQCGAMASMKTARASGVTVGSSAGETSCGLSTGQW